MALAVIQARMGSSRLPGKVLAEVAGRPMLGYMLERLERSEQIGKLVVATSTQPADEQIATFCASVSVECFRGSEADVLDRYHQVASQHPDQAARAVVRMTADCPLIDPGIVDRAISMLLDSGGRLDYVSNSYERTYPDGLDVEAFSIEVLHHLFEQATDMWEREHVTLYLKQQAHPFRMGQITHDEDLSGLRWTVDQAEDMVLVRAVYEELYPTNPLFSWLDLLAWLRARPALLRTSLPQS